MKILIVEDEVKIAKALAKGLQLEQFVVDISHDGKDALNKVVSGNYDLVILDLMLPVIDGLEALTTLRKRGNTTPVLILTAKDSVQDKVKGLNSGADDYLAKPFAFTELLARVHSLTRRGKTKDSKLKLSNLVLDSYTHEVSRAGELVQLSAREYHLLEYMLRHPGAILSEGQIIDHVWSYNYDGVSNVVAVYIRYLRNKIDKAFADEKPLIKTVKGLGYRLME